MDYGNVCHMGENQDNPFAFGVFVSGEQFYDRVEMRADLLRYIRNRQNVLLYGPRRYGKSSLASDVAGGLKWGQSPGARLDKLSFSVVLR